MATTTDANDGERKSAKVTRANGHTIERRWSRYHGYADSQPARRLAVALGRDESAVEAIQVSAPSGRLSVRLVDGEVFDAPEGYEVRNVSTTSSGRSTYVRLRSVDA